MVDIEEVDVKEMAKQTGISIEEIHNAFGVAGRLIIEKLKLASTIEEVREGVRKNSRRKRGGESGFGEMG